MHLEMNFDLPDIYFDSKLRNLKEINHGNSRLQNNESIQTFKIFCPNYFKTIEKFIILFLQEG